MAVSRRFPGFVTDSAFLTIKRVQRSKLGMRKGSFL